MGKGAQALESSLAVFPGKHISRQLRQKWSTGDLSWCLNEISVSLMEAFPTVASL